MSKRKSNKKVKQMICDAMEFARPTYEENPSYRYKFGRYWILDENDGFQLKPYMLSKNGMTVVQGVISLTANQLKGIE